MINANELRLGNWVFDNGKPKRILELHESEVVIDKFLGSPQYQGSLYGNYKAVVTNVLRKYSDIDPIPLTPEVLEKCGLPEDGNTKEVHPSWEICLERDDNKLFLVLSNSQLSHLIEVKYLHQLQNLYFARTGEDLQVELINNQNQ